MKINSKQHIVITISVALFLLSELFPPWLYKDEWISVEKSAGFHFILSPDPEVKPEDEMKRIFSISDDALPLHVFVCKNLVSLNGQRFSLLFLALGLLLILDDRKSYSRVVWGGVFLFIGFGFVGLYILKYWTIMPY